MARTTTLKCFQGNLDGSRHGLVVASSQAKAAAIAGCSVKAFRDYWSLVNKWPTQELKVGTLYTQPIGNRAGTRDGEWVEGRCPIIRK